MKNIAFVGLGKMGTYMAANIIKAGLNLTVYNRTTHKAKKFAKKFNCRYEPSIKQLCKTANIIILCLTTDDVVKNTTNKILEHVKPGSIIIDHSTINFEIAQKLYAKAKKRNISFLDAPITGGYTGAQNGKLSMMVGGSNSAFKKAQHVMKTYSKTLEYMGRSGQGQLTKISNGIIGFNIKQGLIEGLNFANKYGIDRKKLVNILLNGSAYSYQLKTHAKDILSKQYEKNRHYGIKQIAGKEISIIMKNIKRVQLRLPCTEQIAKMIKQ
jgi:3-hydroxyisobutyrate dehydrogenase